LCLCAAAVEQINKGKYDKIVWVRNNIEVKDTTPLGALPGSEWDKLAPFVGPLADHTGGEEGLRKLIEEDKLNVVHLGYLRGRDLRNCIIMCSESENMTKEHLQLLLGRVGEGSALWLDADIKQRDKLVFEKSAGIETMVERLKGNPLFGYVHLVKSERSAASRLADLLD
jgi:PhoH-like ATPase